MVKKWLAGLLVAGLLASFLMPVVPVLAAPSWLGTWAHRIEVSIDNTDIDAALTDFPFLIYISTASGINNEDLSCVFDELTLDANRKKIAVTTSDYVTQCYVEIEKWDDANEKAWLWVKVPSVSGTVDTDLYLYYDSTEADNDTYVGDPGDAVVHNVWDANYKMVQHMNSASNAQLVDSTSQNNDTTANTLDTATGKIGLGMNSDETEIATINDNASLSALSPITAEIWMKSSDAAGSGILLVKYAVNNREWYLGAFPGDDRLALVVYDESENTHIGREKAAAGIFDNAWHHLVGVWDGGTTSGVANLKVYKDGIQIDNASIDVGNFLGIEDLAAPTDIGGISSEALYAVWDLDEARISEAERNAAWIKASYESERDDLIDFGVEETFTAPTITTTVCSGFEPDWAILNGLVVDEGSTPLTSVGFDYGLTDGYGTSDTKAVDELVAGDVFWMKIDPLDAGSNFHWRAKGSNGDWGYGGDAVFSTEGSPTLYEYLNTGGDAVGDDIYAGNWAYMQFTIGTVAHSLDFSNLYVIRTGANPGNAILSIRHADGADKPTGSDLDTITMDADLFSLALNWEQFDFPDDITLEAGESYALVLRCPDGDAANYLEWRWDAGGSLANAIAGKSTDSGVSWTAEGTADYLFENWGEPVFEVLDVNVFTGYIEDDDWLVVLTYKNYYSPPYPEGSCPAYFYLQLLDDVTVIAQTNCQAWGYKPGSFYFSKALADAMEWGNADYKVRLYGDFGTNPYVDYNIANGDWRGSELQFLDTWIIEQANLISDDTGVTLTVTVTDKGEILNAIGRYMFTLGIPRLDEVREDLFVYLLHSAEYEENTYTDAQQAATDWEARVGVDVASMLTSGGTILGLGGQQAGMMIVAGVTLLIIAGLAMSGHLGIGIMLGFIPLLTGTWLGFIDWIVLLVIVVILGGGLFIYKYWLSR